MSSFRQSFVVRRRGTGSYNAQGRYVQDAPDTTFTIKASRQPLSGSDTNLLPEGKRETETYKLYTTTKLYGALQGNVNSDIVIIDDEDYEVIKVEAWQNNVINHYKVIVSKIVTNNQLPTTA